MLGSRRIIPRETLYDETRLLHAAIPRSNFRGRADQVFRVRFEIIEVAVPIPLRDARPRKNPRSSIVHRTLQGTAHTIFESPACVGPASSGASVFFSGRATVFQPVPLQRGQSGRAIKRE